MTQKINWKKIMQYVVPPIITVGLCIYLYKDVDWAEIGAGVSSCSAWLLAAFLGCSVLAMVLRALRWRLQLRAIGVDPTPGEMNRSIFGTYAVNLVFPRLGEFWRCSYISRVASTPFSGVFGSMVADRLADTLAVGLIVLLAFGVSASSMAEFLQHSSVNLGWLLSPWMCLIYGALLLCIILIWKSQIGLFVKVRHFFANMWHGFAAVFTMEHRGLWLLLTFGIWGLYYGSMAVSMLAYPPTAELFASQGLAMVLITFVCGSLAMAIPSNGGIGPWQFAVILALSGIYGLDRTQALTFATINLALNTLLNIALGLYTFLHIALRKK